ncbi:condensation domain-containing protein [Streptomyces sp. R28]|uniref:Condensation domain-containing protein n=1 Tax=Streptomyces sp. R28 TaxID=3238628 RepID=A0AB39QCK0_9ACTN
MAALDPIATDTDILAPMSDLQRHWWGSERLSADPALVMPTAVSLRGRLDAEALGAAARAVAQRHESLRTNFGRVAGKPVQIIHSRPREPVVWTEDISDVPEPERPAALREVLAREHGRPLDLARDPLMQLGVVRRAENDFVLALTLHHMVADGWSVDIQWRDLAREYARVLRGGPEPVDAPPPQMRDWVAREQRVARGPKAAAEIAYWRPVLREVRPVGIPGDLPTGEVPARHRPCTRRFTLPEDMGTALMASAKKFRATPQMIALAAFMRLLGRCAQRPDVAVITLFNRRGAPEVAELVGCVLNFAVIAVSVPPDDGPGPLVRVVRSALLDAYEHQEICAQRIWRETGFSPASVDAMFIFDQEPRAEERIFLGDAVLEPHAEAEENERERPAVAAPGIKFRLHLTRAGLTGGIGYDANRYSPAFIDAFLDAYATSLSETVLD